MSGEGATAQASRAEDRYERRRREIIAAATRVLRRDGVKGMRLAAVAEQLGLTTNSVAYYYRRKEDLAVACIQEALELVDAMIAKAAQETAPADRVRRFLELFLAAHARVRSGAQPPICIFSDIHALTGEQHDDLGRAYIAMHGRVGALLRGPGLEWMTEDDRTARAHLLLEQGYWSEVWSARYSDDQATRLLDRMCDILLNGIAAPGQTWSPEPLPALAPPASDRTEQERFLRAATRLINARGYRGASVNAISAELNLTKGSFYHHLEGKDELVVACFHHSYRLIRQAQRNASALDGDQWVKLTSAAAALVEHQLSPEGPLIRTTALTAVPRELLPEALGLSRRISDHFAAMIADGVTDGSLRPVDPMIGAELLTAAINAASEIPRRAPRVGVDRVASVYARPLLTGLLNP